MLYITVRFGDCSERRRLQRDKHVQVRPHSERVRLHTTRLRRVTAGEDVFHASEEAHGLPAESVRLFLFLHRFASFETWKGVASLR